MKTAKIKMIFSSTLTAQLADKPTRGQSSCRLDNSQTSQLADSEFGNFLDKLRHPRSDAYSAEQVLLNRQQIWCGRAYLDCYREFLNIMEILYFICTLNLAITITATLSNIDSV